MTFAAPGALWLLVVPVHCWRCCGVAVARAGATRALRRHGWCRGASGTACSAALPAWLCLAAAAACLVAPWPGRAVTATAMGRAGVDIVVLADASASMHVQDVAGGRWQRSMAFVRRLGDALSWQDDRVALAAFAHIATPQIRLTRDPNTVFFFLDHLGARPPFRLEDDTTWNTDLEQAVAWGLRILEKDEELHGVVAERARCS